MCFVCTTNLLVLVFRCEQSEIFCADDQTLKQTMAETLSPIKLTVQEIQLYFSQH